MYISQVVLQCQAFMNGKSYMLETKYPNMDISKRKEDLLYAISLMALIPKSDLDPSEYVYILFEDEICIRHSHGYIGWYTIDILEQWFEQLNLISILR